MKKIFSTILIICLCIVLSGCDFSLKNENENKVEKEDENKAEKENSVVDEINKSDYITEEIREKLDNVKKVVINDSLAKEVIRTVTDEQEIDEIINTLSGGRKVTGPVTTEGNTWHLNMYDSEDNLILQLFVWKSGYFGFEQDKDYTFKSGNSDKLVEIINK